MEIIIEDFTPEKHDVDLRNTSSLLPMIVED
jgi:hypothetical protein